MTRLKILTTVIFFFIFFSLIPPHAGKADVPEPVVLFGASSVSVERSGSVNGGTVLSGGDIYIGRSQTVSGDVMAVGDVDVDNGTFVDGDVLAGGITSLGAGVVVSGVVEDGSVDVPLASVDAETVVPGVAGVSVPDGEVRLLSAGAYRTVYVGVGSRLILRGGVYEMERLVFQDNAELRVSNPTRVLLTGDVSIKAGTVVNLNVGLLPSDFLLHSETAGRVTIGESVVFKGVVTVPHGELWIRYLADVEGVFWAETLTVGPQVTINYAPSCVVSAEVCGDGFDQDCDGMDLDCAEVDFDDDGYSESTGDCDESDASINPGAPELCDGEDNNCDGEVDEDTAIDAVDSYQDLDGDGYGTDADVVHGCEIPAGYAANNLDCDDTSDGVNPSVEEICDLVDQNCDGAVDEGIDRCVDGVLLPPDPEDVAPELVETETTSMEESVNFLYEAEEPIQEDVELAEMDAKRVAVAQGKVWDAAGGELTGVTISVKGRPEFGTTLSRVDGEYDVAINGGGEVVLVYRKEGFLPVQRHVTLPVRNYHHVDDVVMRSFDPAMTMVDLPSLARITTAQGSMVSDTDGSRQATMMFRPGTAAEMELEDGSMVPLSTITVRATEYTVGEDGPEALPGPLPPTSGYTYAVELSVDEAVEAGATNVMFSEPVSFYVDNFLNFPAGGVVPVGYYDKEKAAWLPEDDGIVIDILSIDGAGLAELDVDGSGLPADAVTLAELGIDDEEREEIASLYGPGQSLWRVAVDHFSPFDCNWPVAMPDDSSLPDLSLDSSDPDLSCPSVAAGSIIECENRVLGEEIPIEGTDVNLVYRSNRVPVREDAYEITFPVSGEDVPASLIRIDVEVSVAGQFHPDNLDPLPDQEYTFTWDGRDGYNRLIQGQERATVRIGYVYNPSYVDPTDYDFDQSFGQYGSNEIGGNRAKNEVTLWQEFSVDLGVWDNNSQKMGYWTVSEHHVYDPGTQKLYYGDGRLRSSSQETDAITTIVGTGAVGSSVIPDGSDPLSVAIGKPRGITVAPDGTVYFTDASNHMVYKLTTEGVLEVVAGTGSLGHSGDGGPATDAKMNDPYGIALDAEGNLYVAEYDSNRIRKIDTDGIISTFAGTGDFIFSGDGGDAATSPIIRPSDVFVDPQGNVYFTESASPTYGSRVRMVDTNGKLRTVAGKNGFPHLGDYGDEDIATDATFSDPVSVFVAPDGVVYIVDQQANRVRKVGVDGIITTVTGTASTGLGDGGPVEDALISIPFGVEMDFEGNLYIMDRNQYRIRKVTADGIISTVVGNGIGGSSGDNGPASAANISYMYNIAFDADGVMYIADHNNNKIRKVTPFFDSYDETGFTIASEDGTEVYEFDDNGLHLRTRNALTGAIVYEFGYDGGNFLLTMTDGDGNVTTLHRDGSGYVSSIEGPYGHTTALGYTVENHLETVTTPKGEVTRMAYYDGGLLETFTDRNDNTTTFFYDELGNLERDENALGGFIDLVRTEDTETGEYTVTLTTSEGYTTNYSVENQDDGSQRRVFTGKDGLATITQNNHDATTSVTYPDGTIVTTSDTADPRFGMQSPLVNTTTITTPTRGLVWNLDVDKSAVLADEEDPFSMTSLTETRDINGRVFTSVYDVATKTFTRTTPEGRETVTTVDDQERITLVQVPGLSDVSYVYDANGRLETINEGGRVYGITYRTDGLVDTITDPLLQTTSFDYDANGQVIKQTLDDGREIHYSYDAGGNVETITPPSKPAHTFFYNAANLESQYLPPDIGLTTHETIYGYNTDKQLDLITRPDGKTIDFEYDTAGRLETLTTTDTGDTVFAYNALTGNLQNITSPGGGIVTYTYDGSLVTSMQWNGFDDLASTATWDYNNDFQVTRNTINGVEIVDFDYDDDGLLALAGDLSVTRDPLNGFVETTDLNLLHSSMTYNAFGEVETESYEYDGTSVYQVTYIRDDLGRIETKTEIVSGVTNTYIYTYDGTGRLETVTKNGTLISTYMYDSNGNRESYTDETTGTAKTGVYDLQDRLETYGSNTYSYTDNGELLTKDASGSLTNYTYDELGNLLSVDLPTGTTIEYLVDGSNRRVVKKVDGIYQRGFLYKDQLNPVAEINDAGGVISHFIYGTKTNVPDYIVKGAIKYRIISDHLGSPRIVIDTATGDIAQIMEYDEFGQVTNDTNPGFQPFGFAGGLYDHETGLVRFGARDYDAESGRWTAKDPIRFAGGMNLFVYVDGDPVNFVDLYGTNKSSCNNVSKNREDDNSILNQIGKELGLDNFLINLGLSRIGNRTAQEIISKHKKGQINREFPSEYRNKTVNEIFKDADKGVKNAKKAKKLLFDNRFNK